MGPTHSSRPSQYPLSQQAHETRQKKKKTGTRDQLGPMRSPPPRFRPSPAISASAACRRGSASVSSSGSPAPGRMPAYARATARNPSSRFGLSRRRRRALGCTPLSPAPPLRSPELLLYYIDTDDHLLVPRVTASTSPFGGEASAASSVAADGASAGFSTHTFPGIRRRDQEEETRWVRSAPADSDGRRGCRRQQEVR
jgi:hypothetical protein